jgi:putative SOS response-associated peptidase YedK
LGIAAAVRQDPKAARRCLVPADGFYEWTGPKGARRPFLLRSRQGGLIAFAAIWERWRDRARGEIDAFAIITCDANATVASLHGRMPVVLGHEHFDSWLDCKITDASAAQAQLQPAPDDLLEAIEMHPQINDSRRDEPGIQQPLQTQLLL